MTGRRKYMIGDEVIATKDCTNNFKKGCKGIVIGQEIHYDKNCYIVQGVNKSKTLCILSEIRLANLCKRCGERKINKNNKHGVCGKCIMESYENIYNEELEDLQCLIKI